jgi:nitronate monooxygenase
MFGQTLPIFQSPMLGASGPDMAREASLAGALGSLALAGSSADVVREQIVQMKQALGGKPFAANLFILDPAAPDPAIVDRAIARLASFRAELGLSDQAIPNKWAEDFDSQFTALVEAAPPAASFTFGILSPAQTARIKGAGTKIIGTATSIAEAQAWHLVGADAILAQGMEAGGHRGTFLKPIEESLIGIAALMPAIKAAVPLPVIAAGGIMDGRGIAAMLQLGADAVQMGTAFLLAEESTISAPWRTELVGRNADDVRLTRAFSGRAARGIENRFMREMDAAEIPPYPIQNALTQELRAANAKAGRSDMLSLWAGQGVHAIRHGRTADLIAIFWAETRAALRETADRYAS